MADHADSKPDGPPERVAEAKKLPYLDFIANHSCFKGAANVVQKHHGFGAKCLFMFAREHVTYVYEGRTIKLLASEAVKDNDARGARLVEQADAFVELVVFKKAWSMSPFPAYRPFPLRTTIVEAVMKVHAGLDMTALVRDIDSLIGKVLKHHTPNAVDNDCYAHDLDMLQKHLTKISEPGDRCLRKAEQPKERPRKGFAGSAVYDKQKLSGFQSTYQRVIAKGVYKDPRSLAARIDGASAKYVGILARADEKMVNSAVLQICNKVGPDASAAANFDTRDDVKRMVRGVRRRLDTVNAMMASFELAIEDMEKYLEWRAGASCKELQRSLLAVEDSLCGCVCEKPPSLQKSGPRVTIL
jgi:hypothetical protein